MSGDYYVLYVNNNGAKGYMVSDSKVDAISDLNEIKEFCKIVKIKESSSGKIIKEYMKKDKKKLNEAGTVAGAVGADDGPSFMYPSHETYRRASTKDLQKYIETGWKIVSHMMDDGTEEDMMARVYPDGPVGSVSFFPAGDIDDLTPNNQENLFGSEAYDKWKKHTLDTIAKLGWEWVKAKGDDEDEEEAVKDAESLGDEAEEQERDEEAWKAQIKESVATAVHLIENSKHITENIGDFLYLKDQLENAMEYYDKNSFVNHISRQTGYSKRQLERVWDAYWEIPVRDKMAFGLSKGWDEWLNQFGITESIDKKEKVITESKKKKTNEAASKKFSDAAEAYQRESVKLQKMKDDQKKLVDRFKKSEGKNKEKLKDALIKMHRQVKKQQSIVDDAEQRFERAIRDEPEELEELLERLSLSASNPKHREAIASLLPVSLEQFSKYKKEFIEMLNKFYQSHDIPAEIREAKDLSAKEVAKKFKKGDKVKFKGPDGVVTDTIEKVDGIYLKLKKSGTIPYQGVIDEASDKPAGRRKVVDWIEQFNNAVVVGVKQGAIEFKATNFALKGILRELKKMGVDTDVITQFGGNKYGINMKDRDNYHKFLTKLNEGKESINESVGVMKAEGDKLYVDTDFVQNSQKAGTLKHVSMGDFELRLPNGGTIEFRRASKSFPSFSGRAHTVKGDETDIIQMLRKMPKGVVQEAITGADALGSFEEQIKQQLKARAESCGKAHLTDEDIDNWLEGMGNKNNYNEQQIKNIRKEIKRINNTMNESKKMKTISKKEWDKLHRDFKGERDGQKYIVTKDKKSGATKSIPVKVESIDEDGAIFSKLRKGNPNKGGNMRDDVKKVLDKVTKAYEVEDDGVLRFRSAKDARNAYQELNRAGIAASPSFESSKNRFFVYLESKQLNKLKEFLSESLSGMFLYEEVKPSNTIKQIMKVVEDRQAQKIDGFYMDLTTAGIIKQVWEKISDSNKQKLNKLKAGQIADLAYKLIK